MNDFELPPELRQFEQELAARPRPEPSADLAQRVLDGVQAELPQSMAGPSRTASRRNGSRSWWAFAAGTAAAVLVWINLSLSAARETHYGLQFGNGHPTVHETAQQIRRLLPEASPREALRQAVLLKAGSNLARCPDLSARPEAATRPLESRLQPAKAGTPTGPDDLLPSGD